MNRRTGWKRGHATIVRGGITDALDELHKYEDTGLSAAKITSELKELAKYRELGTVEELNKASYDATL